MVAGELINDMIPPLKPSDKAPKAITWMEELRSNQLPVVEKGHYLGLITEDIILEGNDLDRYLSDYHLVAENCYVYSHQHMYEVIKLATDHGVEVVAVLDDEEQFEGIITVQDTLSAFAQSSAVQSPGGIMILSMKEIDYSLSEMARLIESNDARILSSWIVNDVLDPTKIKLTIKVNKTDLSHIIATLERFGYKIIGKFQEHTGLSNEKERFDILLKYLEM